MITNDTFIQMAQTQNLPSNRQKNMDMLTKNEVKECLELMAECTIDGDGKALEIKKIEYEQRLIVERMIRVSLQKERLQNLLEVLQSLDSDDDNDEST
jgi:hypothetical protein